MLVLLSACGPRLLPGNPNLVIDDFEYKVEDTATGSAGLTVFVTVRNDGDAVADGNFYVALDVPAGYQYPTGFRGTTGAYSSTERMRLRPGETKTITIGHYLFPKDTDVKITPTVTVDKGHDDETTDLILESDEMDNSKTKTLSIRRDSGTEPVPDVKFAVGDRSPTTDVLLVIDAMRGLGLSSPTGDGLQPIPVGTAVLFSSIPDVRAPYANVLIAVYNNRSVIIVDDRATAQENVISGDALNWFRVRDIPSRRIQRSLITTPNILDLFADPSCTDSDGGNDFQRVGNVLSGDSGYADGCKSPTVLLEAVCTNGVPKQIETTCPSATPHCNRGACQTTAPTCTDSDGGQVADVAGRTAYAWSEEGPVYEDYCEVGVGGSSPQNGECSGASCYLREFSCGSNPMEQVYKDVPCPDGCSAGACKPGSTLAPDQYEYLGYDATDRIVTFRKGTGETFKVAVDEGRFGYLVQNGIRYPFRVSPTVSSDGHPQLGMDLNGDGQHDSQLGTDFPFRLLNPWCFDEDENSVFKAGTTRVSIDGRAIDQRVVDTCQNATHVRESYCLNYRQTNSTFKCDNGCADGACKSTPASTCTDSDGGITLETRGQLTLVPPHIDPSGKTVIYQDLCEATAATNLAEYSCTAEGGVQHNARECQYGCKEGACVPGSTSIHYVSYDATQRIATMNLQGTKTLVYLGTDGRGTFVVAGTIYYMRRLALSGDPIEVDTDSDGDFDSVARVGQYLDLSNPSPLTCTDTDGGRNYSVRGSGTGKYARGTPTTPITKVEDKCQDSKQLNEVYCDANGVLTTEGVGCPYGCVDGTCAPKVECIESDNGQDAAVNGTTVGGVYAGGGGYVDCLDGKVCLTAKQNRTTYVDGCANDRQLNEGVCQPNGMVGSTGIQCEYGCANGACRPRPALCTDSDAENIYLKGTVTDATGVSTDSCSGTSVVEWYCTKTAAGQDIGMTKTIACPSGYACKEGACQTAPAIPIVYEGQMFTATWNATATIIPNVGQPPNAAIYLIAIDAAGKDAGLLPITYATPNAGNHSWVLAQGTADFCKTGCKVHIATTGFFSSGSTTPFLVKGYSTPPVVALTAPVEGAMIAQGTNSNWIRWRVTGLQAPTYQHAWINCTQRGTSVQWNPNSYTFSSKDGLSFQFFEDPAKRTWDCQARVCVGEDAKGECLAQTKSSFTLQ